MSEPGEDLARSSESGDEGREEEEVGESEDWQKLEEVGDSDRTISGSLVDNVKQINVLLNIPNNCNANTIYDDMIRQRP